MLLSVKQTLAWRAVRGVKRTILRPLSNDVLPADQCRSVVRYLNPPVALEAGTVFTARFSIENRSGIPWVSRGRTPVRLRCRWLTYRGDRFTEGTAFDFSHPIFPGEPRTIEVTLATPSVVGDFILEADLIQDGQTAFAERNPYSEAVRVAIPVQGRRTTDIDYHAVYRTADLDRNHWWVVGAYHSREDYERSSRQRVEMLQKYGLTPDSRVLDIGCGTGQIAGPLLHYLSDHGAYYGTDIGKEAIDFCQRAFRRRNFVFRQGEMTRVPFDTTEGPFDLAIFFSVFTHTFVDESVLLLSEARRLLRSGGRVIADIITSPLVERGAGHRGEMVVNRDHFTRLAASLGYLGDVIGRWEWNPHAERLMMRFVKS